MDASVADANQKIQHALDYLRKELSGIRAGRANPQLLEEIPVQAYGTTMKMMEVGTIAAPQPTLLTVTAWDGSVIKDIEKAIRDANLGLNPAVDGTTIRVPIPPLTEERRQEFTKLARVRGEDCKVDIRKIRQEQRSDWDKDEDSGTIGEDEHTRLEKQLQDLIDKSTAMVDEMVKQKEQELMQI
jgi:ribosome recycling factor